MAPLYKESKKLKVLEALEEALAALNEFPSKEILMPEVRMNFVYALPEAEAVEEVAAFPGRITFDGRAFRAVGPPRFGASSHMARALIAYMRRYPEVRAALNVRHSEELLGAARRASLVMSGFDRREEPGHDAVGGRRGLKQGRWACRRDLRLGRLRQGATRQGVRARPRGGREEAEAHPKLDGRIKSIL